MRKKNHERNNDIFMPKTIPNLIGQKYNKVETKNMAIPKTNIEIATDGSNVMALFFGGVAFIRKHLRT